MYRAVDEYASEISDSKKNESMQMVDVDKLCLARVRDAFYRGKIVHSTIDENSEIVTVFLVDTGETVDVECTDVFDIPESLVEMCAYQVCGLEFSLIF